MMPAARLQAAHRFDAQGVVQPALDEVELELAPGELERVALVAVGVLRARDDDAVAAARLNPRREREFVVEAEFADVARVDEALAVEVDRPADPARDVAGAAALAVPRPAAARP